MSTLDRELGAPPWDDKTLRACLGLEIRRLKDSLTDGETWKSQRSNGRVSRITRLARLTGQEEEIISIMRELKYRSSLL